MVDVDVPVQLVLPSVGEAAGRAGVRPLPGVDAEVTVQTILEIEACGAELAAEGSVDVLDVFVDPTLSGERLSAVWT